jgi:hypothetical protein
MAHANFDELAALIAKCLIEQEKVARVRWRCTSARADLWDPRQQHHALVLVAPRQRISGRVRGVPRGGTAFVAHSRAPRLYWPQEVAMPLITIQDLPHSTDLDRKAM